MKRTWAILAMSAVCGLVGCNSTDMPNSSASNKADSYYNTGSSSASNYGKHDINSESVNNAGNNSNTPQLNYGTNKTKMNTALSDQDRAFIQDANGGNMFEVQAGDKAVAKTSDAHVKAVAQHMVADHTKAEDQLKALAQRKGVELSSLPSADQVKMLGDLDKLNGSDFDREYLNQQRQAHKDTISKFETEANAGTDRDTRDWAASTLPTLREHLRMINNESTPNMGMEQ